ncbi:MAG: glycosyltransferase family 4 protein [Spirosomataceae bacterium]
MPFYNQELDFQLGIIETRLFSRWVANNLPECDAYIAISGSGLQAGRVAKKRGAGYIMDRGSTHIKFANEILSEEYRRWNIPWKPISPWLIDNEEAEAAEANLITIPSHFVKQTFIQYGVDAAKLRVVPYGVSLKEFYPVDQPPVDCFRLVFVGQFSLRKGALYLLEAFKNFKHPNKELVVLGHVPIELKTLISQIGYNHVRFVGMVPRSKVKEYMSSSHALVLPSIEEGLALVQVQALACGCPVIATPNTGSETLFQHAKHGLIIESKSSKALTDAFVRLADEPSLREQMRTNGLQLIQHLGGWQTYAQGIVKVAMETQKPSIPC